MRRSLALVSLFLLASAPSAQGSFPISVSPLPPVPVPADNPMTVEKALLGKALFWDEQLSSTRAVACGTCHIPSSGGSDPRSALAGIERVHPGNDGKLGTFDDAIGSPGVVGSEDDGRLVATGAFGLRAQVTPRKTPTMINAAYEPVLFWDGRASNFFLDPLTNGAVLFSNAALEAQAVGPPLNTTEMAHHGRDWVDVVDRLEGAQPLALATDVPDELATFVGGRTYADLFADAFGTTHVTPARIGMAIATYERTLISNQSPFDDFVAGNETALSPEAQLGRTLFNGAANCSTCHGEPEFTNHVFANVGARPANEDLGLYLVTKLPSDRGKFKVPSLRNVALRAPYFHSGSAATLEDVVEFYDRGGDFQDNKSLEIHPLGLTPEEKAALVAFLEALTDPRVEAELPPFDRPTLYSETARVPETYGGPTLGSGGAAPRVAAVEPPHQDNPSFTLGVWNGLGGAPAFLSLDAQGVETPIPLFGIGVHLAMTPALSIRHVGPLSGAGPGEGYTSRSFDLGSTAGLEGTEVYAQWFVLDPGSTAEGGFSASEGVRFTVF